MDPLELRAQRAKHIADARAILDKAQKENRELSAEERQSWDKLHEAADLLKGKIDIEEKQRKAQADLNASQGRQADAPQPGTRTRVSRTERRLANDPVRLRRAGLGYRKMFRSFLTGGFRAFGVEEHRNLQADVDLIGGYLLPPMQFVDQLIKFVDNFTFVRQMATVISVTNAQSMGAPSLDTDPDDATWTSELNTGNEDSSMAFGRRELTPYPLARRIKISNKALRLLPKLESFVAERMGYKFGITEEKAFLTGSGAQQPLGLFTASANGVSTGRDVSTGNTITAITADGLLNAKYSLKAQYQQSPTTCWMFSRTAIKELRKLKDGVGNYIWSPGLSGGEPDRIFDVPFYMSEYVPAVFTTGLYVGLIGDMKFYWIAEALDMQMQRLDELYAETNQTGFIGRMELDGMPVLEEAFARVTLA